MSTPEFATAENNQELPEGAADAYATGDGPG